MTYVENLIAIERAYINTNHPDFLGAAGAMASLEQESRKKMRLAAFKRRQLAAMNYRSDSASVVSGQEENSSKESLFSYFFGRGGTDNKNEKSNVESVVVKAQEAAPPLNSIVQNEMIKKLEQISLDDEFVTDKEELEIQLIRKCNINLILTCLLIFFSGTLITSYFNIVKKNIQDLVPKSIMHLLVNHSRESIQNRLVSILYKEEIFDELLQEDETISVERERCKAMLKMYKQAFELIKSSI